LLGALVASHWVLDLIVHIPDLPLYPGNSPKFGFGLWNSIVLTILVEGVIFLVGVVLYIKTKKDLGERITWWFWSLVTFLIIIHTMNFVSAPPPNVAAIAWAGHLQWLFVLWGWWADKK
jgi:FtsH-binding integral membrane protein